MISWFQSSTTLWVAVKMLFSKRRKFLTVTGWISLAGLTLGVASLVVSMAVISGFESTLQANISDVSGHLQVYKLTSDSASGEQLLERLRNIEPSITAASRFFVQEGVLAHQGKLAGVLLEGVDESKISQVLRLQNRVIQGRLDLKPADDGTPQALIGKGLARDFNLKPGDDFRIVVPVNTDLDVSQFHRRIGHFRVSGVLSLGKYEQDQRWILTSLPAAQDLADIGTKYSGFLLRLKEFDQAEKAARKLTHELGPDYRVRHWREISGNLFEAIKIEKVVIFFVIFIIVIAAAFNVASSLYISVVRSYPEIGILKALGMAPKKIARIFSVQGVVLGGFGCFCGLVLGLILSLGFTILEDQFTILPASVYKIDRIEVQLRLIDLVAIVISTLLICYLATWAPARKAALMTAVEGLRHE